MSVPYSELEAYGSIVREGVRDESCDGKAEAGIKGTDAECIFTNESIYIDLVSCV